ARRGSSANACRGEEPSRKPGGIVATGRGGGLPSRRDRRGTEVCVGRGHAWDIRGLVGTKRGVAPSRRYFSAPLGDGVHRDTTSFRDSCSPEHELTPAESHLPLAAVVPRHPTPGT